MKSFFTKNAFVIISLVVLGTFALSFTALGATRMYKIKVTSSAFKNNKAIPSEHGYILSNTPIPLTWNTDVKAKSKIASYAVTMIDKNTSSPKFVHLMIINIPSVANTLEEALLSGTLVANSYGEMAYGGPNPPEGEKHTYEISVYGLSTSIATTPTNHKTFLAAIKGKVVAKGMIKGKFGTTGNSSNVTPPPAQNNQTTPPPAAITPPPPSSSGTSGGSSSKTMSFFVTSRGNGERGGNYGGLSGADQMCADFAAESSAAGASSKTWRAYMSNSSPRVNAIDRIGNGPWYNFSGKLITKASLNAGIKYADMLDEKGGTVQRSNEHDIVTGSDNSGELAVIDGNPHTCSDWSDGSDNSATTVGHADWDSGDGQNWQSQHTVSCSAGSFRGSAGVGRIYCFATN